MININSCTHTFIFKLTNISYRVGKSLNEDEFERYMNKLDWVLPFNIRVAHSSTAGESVLNTFPFMDVPMDIFLNKRKGIQLIPQDTKPIPVIYKWYDLLVVPTSLGIPRLIRYIPKSAIYQKEIFMRRVLKKRQLLCRCTTGTVMPHKAINFQ